MDDVTRNIGCVAEVNRRREPSDNNKDNNNRVDIASGIAMGGVHALEPRGYV